MLQTGIYKLSQIKNYSKFKDFFGNDKKVSITLYDQITNEPNADKLAERILLSFSDERGAYKRTYSNRFEDFDYQVEKFLFKHFNKNDSIIIQDVAISDGRTAIDFFRRISIFFPNIIFYASDYNPKVYIIEQKNIKITLSNTYKILEIVWPPFVFAYMYDKSKQRQRYLFNFLILAWIKLFKVAPLLKSYYNGKVKARELLLFSPNALDLSKQDNRFHLLQYDLLEPFKYKTHIIRAMNVLSTYNFSDKEFKCVLNNIYDGLWDKGFLVTGSNRDPGSDVYGGIYQKTDKGFIKVWQSKYTSPVEDYILYSK